MRAYARLRPGRILALGVRVWLRRSLQIHVVAALCLAPLCLAPLVILDASKRPFQDGTLPGLFGLYAAAWTAATGIFEQVERLARSVTAAYLAQFAVTVIVARDAHRRLAGRAPRSGPRALLGLVLLALGSLAVFTLLDSVVANASGHVSLWPIVAFVPVSIAEAFLAGAFWLALPAAAVDGHGILPALGRGRLLSRGSRFAVFSLVFLMVLLQWLVLIPFGWLTGVSDLHSEWLMAIPVVLFLTLKACVLAAAYHEACIRKEGPRAEDIGRVFA